MKSLVTGGAGFIGSNLVDQLVELGHEVVVIDNEYSDVHEQFYYNDKVENHNLDIRDPATRPLYDGVDYVFHIAAEARIQPAVHNPIEAVSINSVGTYSVSKVNGEKLCSMYTSLFGLKTIILRYFNVYGNRHPLKGQYAPVIGIFLRQLRDGEALTVVGDGEQRRDFTNVLDVVSANVLAATKKLDDDAFGQVYNVGTGTNHSINEIANMISDNIKHIPPRLGEARITLAHNSKIKGALGWEPKIKLEDWISEELG